MKKENKVALKLLILMAFILIFFATFLGLERRGDSWVSIVYIITPFLYPIFGIFFLVKSIIFLKRKIFSPFIILLFIASFLLLTWKPALFITDHLEKLIFFKHYAKEHKLAQIEYTENLNSLNKIFSEYMTVLDVEDNYLLLNRKLTTENSCMSYDTGLNGYYVVYLPDIKQGKNTESFIKYIKSNLINKEITASIFENQFIKERKNFSTNNKHPQGLKLIERNTFLKNLIENMKSKGVDMSDYSKYEISLDCNMQFIISPDDIPVNLYFNGTLINSIFNS